MSSICFPCNAANMLRIYPSVKGSFSPLTKKKSAYMDDDDAGLRRKQQAKKRLLFHSGEANIHFTTDKSFALNMGAG